LRNTHDRAIVENYRNLLRKHGSGPEVGQWSAEGQRFRFEKLIQIGDLKGKRILDLGCGIGDLYPLLLDRFGEVDYTGVDIVPEIVASAAGKYPDARFECRDLLAGDLGETFDYVLISGMFNNARPDCTVFLKQMIVAAFRHCRVGLGFNFISTHVNTLDDEMAYHDPAEVLSFCLENLTRKVSLHHHYERCDVVVFAYK